MVRTAPTACHRRGIRSRPPLACMLGGCRSARSTCSRTTRVAGQPWRPKPVQRVVVGPREAMDEGVRLMDDIRGEPQGGRPYDYFDAVPNYTDTVPDYRRLARAIGQSIAATRPLAHNGRAFWKLTDADSGALAWLAFTRPDARSALARRKLWTLIPYLQEFMANWFVSVDHELTEQSLW